MIEKIHIWLSKKLNVDPLKLFKIEGYILLGVAIFLGVYTVFKYYIFGSLDFLKVIRF